MNTADMTFWQGIFLYLAIVLSPVVVVGIWVGVTELLDRAYLRGYDRAWRAAVQASELGMKLT